MTTYTAESVDALVRVAVPDAEHVEVEDQSGGCGGKFLVIVVSKVFEGMPLLDRHRMVQDSLGDALKGDIHALTLKTWTPKQYEAKKAKS
mmetsp:Transcript_6642/g.12265  ORF Transcript_6642/g.12265 Transcript_6642/m.12265 type:complete len:90 (+) Transcript_6642:210-479(+)|eukprot:CAMPEP_0184542702 /NCGR_PEP_ID=MMETSP0199_2-20130426/2327_1 /TAXON_ID=1112570 /ORGANISM="Thraustochytrium sp., Strain LLF1b" /LENGTH=89 /DNA_ID=CAMNT_0026936585 /DNA_START=186 /DNA_END=455 /DNA_ORIENTATION=+